MADSGDARTGLDIVNRRFALSALLGVVLSLVSARGAWADYPPAAPTVQLVTNSAPCSATVGASGSNWKPNSLVTLTLQNPTVIVGSATTNGSGGFTTNIA